MADAVSKYSQPPFDDFSLTFDIAPVSLQASRVQKEVITAAIRKELEPYAYILTGEVSISLEWMIHDRHRYETDTSPDVDNVLKPTIDALSGPKGIIVDDNQVQAISCYWVDWKRDDQKITITIKYHPDEWHEKDALVFVHVGNRLYMPINESVPKPGLEIMLEAWEGMFAARAKLMEEGLDYYSSLRILPIQRAFHKSRIVGKFPIYEMEEFRNRHGLAIKSANSPTR